MVKTVKEWLTEMPDGYRERALKNMRHDAINFSCDCMQEAISVGLKRWDFTSEGNKFWNKVDDHYRNGTPLPPLPTDTVESKPILSQSQVEDILVIMGQRIQAMEAKIDILLARTEPKVIDPTLNDNDD